MGKPFHAKSFVSWTELVWLILVFKIKRAAWWWTSTIWYAHLDNMFLAWNYQEPVGLLYWRVERLPNRWTWSNKFISLINYTKSIHDVLCERFFRMKGNDILHFILVENLIIKSLFFIDLVYAESLPQVWILHKFASGIWCIKWKLFG